MSLNTLWGSRKTVRISTISECFRSLPSRLRIHIGVHWLRRATLNNWLITRTELEDYETISSSPQHVPSPLQQRPSWWGEPGRKPLSNERSNWSKQLKSGSTAEFLYTLSFYCALLRIAEFLPVLAPDAAFGRYGRLLLTSSSSSSSSSDNSPFRTFSWEVKTVHMEETFNAPGQLGSRSKTRECPQRGKTRYRLHQPPPHLSNELLVKFQQSPERTNGSCADVAFHDGFEFELRSFADLHFKKYIVHTKV